ncbi:hepatitis A virus cellular receptor 1 homolog isoform X2 [Bombina bombina]|uniref:hepatitis A virus cellular receptor 1 homolog isoform X2 n=1 Tax=Bombina bombina TaxID=8345 RepID=UPI00235A9009|nr:hepatitis A virus cellular receptor 1 homolog isoform X2 [Bombina bombina]
MAPVFLWICISMLTFLALSDSTSVSGSVGDTVHLSCTYSVQQGTTNMCWGRGSCPFSYCNQVIVETDGSKVTQRKSDRYQLKGDIAKGNVSLTIINVTRHDTGTYCCRAEIWGLFNDEKVEIEVQIHDREVNSGSSTTAVSRHTHGKDIYESRTTSLAHQTHAAGTTDTRVFNEPTDPLIPYSGEDDQEFTHLQGDIPEDSSAVPYISIALVLLLISLAIVTVYIYKYRKRKKETPRSSVPMGVRGTLEDSANHTEDNIYIIENI